MCVVEDPACVCVALCSESEFVSFARTRPRSPHQHILNASEAVTLPLQVLRLARILKIINKLAAANAKKDNEEDDNEKAGAAAAAGHNPGSPRLADDGLDHEEEDDGEDEDVGAVSFCLAPAPFHFPRQVGCRTSLRHT